MGKIEENKSNSEDIVIEEAFEKLARIAEALENPNTSLKDSLRLYSEGVVLVNACKENLEGVEKEIQIINEKQC